MNVTKILTKVVRQLGLLTAILMLAWTAALQAAPAVLISWPANPETNIAGYIVYYGTASSNYTTITNVGNTTNFTLTGLVEGGTYYVAVSAYNDWGLESAITNECSFHLNAPPTLTLPAARLAALKQTATPVRGLLVSDPDAGSANLDLLLSATRGKLMILTTVPGGVTASQVTFNGSANVLLRAPLAALNATLSQSNGVVYTGSLNLVGADRISLTVEDKGNTGLGGNKKASTAMAVDVTGDGYDSWRNWMFDAADLTDVTKQSSLWGDAADPDSDTYSNLMEYALSRDPLIRDPATFGFTIKSTTIGDATYNTLVVSQRKNDPSIQYVPEVSPDNTNWFSSAQDVLLLNRTDLSSSMEEVTYRDATPPTPGNPSRAIKLTIRRR